jgi:hypothetical protein
MATAQHILILQEARSMSDAIRARRALERLVRQRVQGNVARVTEEQIQETMVRHHQQMADETRLGFAEDRRARQESIIESHSRRLS